jgi:glutaredoxin-related protein
LGAMVVLGELHTLRLSSGARQAKHSSMERLILSAENVASPALEVTANMYRELVASVSQTVKRDHIVVVGMAQNPFVKKARKLLNEAGVTYTYLEYGSYLSQWKQRLAIKLWAGFPTFPMVFVDGTLIGGFKELCGLRDRGELQ